MKVSWIALLTWAVMIPGTGFAQRASVQESPAELAGGLDANGDGLTDFLVVDKTSGIRQLGLQQADGSFNWADPASTGLDHVTGLGLGQFMGSNAVEGFAVAAPLANRVMVFPDPAGDGSVAPIVGIGPNLVVGFNFAGDSRDDLAIGTEWDNGAVPAHLSGLMSSDFGLSPIYGPHEESGTLSRGNRARFARNRPWMLGALREASGGKEFIARPIYGFPGFADGPTLGGLPADTEWVWGEFKTNDLARFLFYSPGGTTLDVPGLAEPNPYEYAWTSGDTYDLGQPIARVMVLPQAVGAMLLVVFNDETSAATYDFDGTQAPVLRQTFTAPPGSRFSVGVPLAGGDFLMLNGAAGGAGSSTGWQRWRFDGTRHALAASGSLPALQASQGRANVLLFGANFDLDPNAPLLGTLRVGDWSVSAIPAGGTVHVTREQFLGPTLGLGAPTAADLSVSPLALFAAANQRGATESMAVFQPPTSAVFADLSFSPAPGTYHLGSDSNLEVQIISATGDPVQYRTGSTGPWTLFDPANPPLLSSTTTLQAFVDTALPGPVRCATYVIANAPALVVPPPVDSTHSGLPDSWKQTFGLTDPQGDPDGDGATNLQEYLAGTDPLDPLSFPTNDLTHVTLVARLPGPTAPAGTICEIAWPAAVTNFVLETTMTLTDPSSWTAVGGTAAQVGGEWVYDETASPVAATRFYRLRIQP